MREQTKNGEDRSADRAVLRRVTTRLPFSSFCRNALRGLPAVTGDDAAEFSLATDLAHGLWAEIGVKHVVPDLPSLVWPLPESVLKEIVDKINNRPRK